jgi:hypothetical protein
VDLIVGVADAIQAARDSTQTIPTVTLGGDRFVESLARVPMIRTIHIGAIRGRLVNGLERAD